MSRPRKHKDVEFHVETEDSRRDDTQIFETFDEAAGIAVARAASGMGAQLLDIIVWSESGARWLAGDDGVEQYRVDPEASVFERIVIKADNQGRVP